MSSFDSPPKGHTISLRQAWEFLGPDENRTGAPCLQRRFHWVAALSEGERLLLVCRGGPLQAAVLLNGEPIGELSKNELRADITHLVRKANLVAICCPPGIAASESLHVPDLLAQLPEVFLQVVTASE